MPHDNQLCALAQSVRQRAYAPYSRFTVGACLLADDGTQYTGVNVENASFGLTICAERSALVAAITAGRRQFTAIAIASSGGCLPCGACRQALAEFAPQLRVLIVNADEPAPARCYSLDQLLPDAFHF